MATLDKPQQPTVFLGGPKGPSIYQSRKEHVSESEPESLRSPLLVVLYRLGSLQKGLIQNRGPEGPESNKEPEKRESSW